MSLFEGNRSYEQRLAEIIPVREKELEMYERMSKIQLFPGSLEEYQIKTGETFEFIEIPGTKQFLEGGLRRWRTEINQDVLRVPFKRRDWLRIRQWDRFYIANATESYSEIVAQASALEADALIHYKSSVVPTSEGIGTTRKVFSGVPVRRIAQISPENP